MHIVRSIVVLGIVATGGVSIGCASTADDDAMGEGELKPESIRGTGEQRTVCIDRVKENGAQRDGDLDVGVVRWKCGDVKGVTGKDLGQEYCEFHAVQEGAVVDNVAKSKVKPAKVECVFTGVYRDVKGRPGGAENKTYGEHLNEQLANGAGNLKEAQGIKLPTLGENPFSVMNGQFNARQAATQLLSDCAEQARDQANADRVNKVPDEVQCDASGANCASSRDVEACTLIVGKGEGWRNSDPIICGRAARGTLCGGSYGALPPTLDGFIMTDWNADLAQAVKLWTGKATGAPSAPDGCRYATIDGKPYLHLMICTPTQTQVTNPKFEGQLQQMCSEVFGPKIAMTAPIGLVTTGDKADDGFCGKFHKGVETLKSVAR